MQILAVVNSCWFIQQFVRVSVWWSHTSLLSCRSSSISSSSNNDIKSPAGYDEEQPVYDTVLPWSTHRKKHLHMAHITGQNLTAIAIQNLVLETIWGSPDWSIVLRMSWETFPFFAALTSTTAEQNQHSTTAFSCTRQTTDPYCSSKQGWDLICGCCCFYCRGISYLDSSVGIQGYLSITKLEW